MSRSPWTRRGWLGATGMLACSAITGCRSDAKSEPIWVGHLTRGATLGKADDMTVNAMQRTLADWRDAEETVAGRTLGVRHVSVRDKGAARAEATRLLAVNRVVCLIVDPGVEGAADVVAVGKGHGAAVILLGEIPDPALVSGAILLGPDPVRRGELLARYALTTGQRKRAAALADAGDNASAAMVQAFLRTFRQGGGQILPRLSVEQIVARHKTVEAIAPDIVLLGRVKPAENGPPAWAPLAISGMVLVGESSQFGEADLRAHDQKGEIWIPTLLPQTGQLPVPGQAWVERFVKQFAVQPTADAVLAHDAIGLIASALQAIGGDDRRKLAEELAGRSELISLTGVIPRRNGAFARPVYLVRYLNGKKQAAVELPG